MSQLGVIEAHPTAPTAPVVIMASLEVVDLQVVASLRALGRDVHDAGFVPELVEQFATDSAARLLGMRAAVDDAQLEVLGRLAHALKGAAAQLGGVRLVAACVGLEDAVEAGSAPRAEMAYATVEREYGRLRPALIEQAGRAG